MHTHSLTTRNDIWVFLWVPKQHCYDKMVLRNAPESYCKLSALLSSRRSYDIAVSSTERRSSLVGSPASFRHDVNVRRRLVSTTVWLRDVICVARYHSRYQMTFLYYMTPWHVKYYTHLSIFITPVLWPEEQLAFNDTCLSSLQRFLLLGHFRGLR